MSLKDKLFSLADADYAAFTAKLIPNVDPGKIIGVRTPDIRSLAKACSGAPEGEAFLNELPHEYFEENQLHSFIISLDKNFDSSVEKVRAFLPYVDNWATCDQLNPAAFAKNADRLMPFIDECLSSGKTYTVRFGIRMLMNYFLTDKFTDECALKVSASFSEDYYVKMMISWYFATALAYQYDRIIPYFEQRRLDPWVHNKAIQKARESRRISDESKEYLKSLKVKNISE